MLTWFRLIASLLSFPFIAVVTLNIQVLATDRGWDGMLLTAYPAVVEEFAFLTSPLVFALAAFVIGITCGAWAHWLGSKIQRPEANVNVRALPSTSEVHRSGVGAAKAGPDNWREAFKGRTHFRLYEAAIILADIPPQKPITDAGALAHFENIRTAICRGDIRYKFPSPNGIANIAYSLSGSVEGSDALDTWREAHITPETSVRVDALVRYYKKVNDQTQLSKLTSLMI